MQYLLELTPGRSLRIALLLALLAGCNATSNTVDTDTGTPPVDVVTDSGSVDAPPVDVPQRCRSNAECAGNPGGPVCETTTGACVGCLASPTDTCPAAQHCEPSSRRCVAGCNSDEGCTEGAARRCDIAQHVCVECVTDDHCTAGQLCRGSRCVAGCTETRTCPTGQACCNGGCVDTQSNVADCGACGNTCRAPNGVPGCTAGVCAIASCTAPYADCDAMASNGCETNTQISATHCGTCGTACPVPANGTATCRAGACGVTCNAGFGDCDGMASNGCEADTRATAAHCGACGRACEPPNATGACAAGECGVGTCNAGFGNCDADPANGCETSTGANPNHCGRCGNACTAPANARATCAAGACGFVCNPGYGDCDGDATNGCEVDLNTSAPHCGACGQRCSGTCAAGVCSGMTCPTGRGDCDGDAANGCEQDTTASVAHCGGCRRACAAGPNATATCAASACGVTCAAGFGDCDSNAVNGCEVETRVSPTHCGACGRGCASGEVCSEGTCVAPCPGSQTRCSGTCVSTETSNLHCGRCGNACPSGSTCSGATCRCALSGDPLGGVQCGATCVDVTTSATNCGACGNVCPTGTTCQRGTCRCAIGGVPIGVQCGATCVDPLTSNTNCGRCGNACPTGESCVLGACRCVIAGGGAGTTCSGTCVDLRTSRNNCGACGTVCPTGQVCTSSACVACATGRTACGDTCVDTQTNRAHCGGCDRACSSTQACVSGACVTAPLYHGWTSPLAGCVTTGFNATAPTNQGGTYPYNTGDSNACRAWKLAATVCTTNPTAYSDTNNWYCPVSGGFTDPVFGAYCLVNNQYACSTCPGACNAECAYTPLSLRNCSGTEASQP